MTAHELLKRIESKTAPVIIDARTGSEFKRGHIPGAINAQARQIPLKTVRLPEDPNAELVIYCGHGPRAMVAKRLLARQGYRNLDLLKGHWKLWRNAGLPAAMT